MIESAQSASAYERLGGEPGLREVLRDLYDRLYADLMIGFFFRPHDKARLVESQLRFVGRALGGPDRYEGAPIRRAHAALPILDGHFWRRHRILEQTLRDHRVAEDIIDTWLALDRKLRPSVVQGAAAAARPPGSTGPGPSGSLSADVASASAPPPAPVEDPRR